ncbi:MAG: hypothetical protein CM1200mP30_34390 [Pseudomonadota bacterium]|nr:MAG: hypothetical protein CM1200mP30_34390 [Pseudomonadota bacterium]
MSFPDKLTLSPLKNISGIVDLPGSKSLSNRILLLSMLAEGHTEIHNYWIAMTPPGGGSP